MNGIVLSLFDYTGEAVRPWAENGYDCVCFDIQHSATRTKVERVGTGSITYMRADLHNRDTLSDIAREYRGEVVFMSAFPECTNMAVSGAAHFKEKLAVDPLAHEKAGDHAKWAAKLADMLGCPYYIENPVSVLSTLWRKPDYSFHPYEYGGYLPSSDIHPQWPDHIAPRDAYPKKTCLWVGGGFVMPPKLPVACPAGYSAQHRKLGGKSTRTKNIRSATPRGFARAVMLANAKTKVAA